MLSGVAVFVHGRVVIPNDRLLVALKNVELAGFADTVAALDKFRGLAVDGVENFAVVGDLLAGRVVVFGLAELAQFGLPLVAPKEFGGFLDCLVELLLVFVGQEEDDGVVLGQVGSILVGTRDTQVVETQTAGLEEHFYVFEFAVVIDS